MVSASGLPHGNWGQDKQQIWILASAKGHCDRTKWSLKFQHPKIHMKPPNSKLSSSILVYHHWCFAKLNTTCFISTDIHTKLNSSLQRLHNCHSNSHQLTANCGTCCPQQLSEQFSNSILEREQRELSERCSHPSLEAAGLRLCWFSFPSPQLNSDWQVLTPQLNTVSCSVQGETIEKLAPWNSCYLLVCGCPMVKEVRWKTPWKQI